MAVQVVGGIRMEYERSGLPGGPTVVLHHGLIGSAAVSPEWRQRATAAGIDLLSVARPGYGQSDPAALDTIAEWGPMLAGLLDGLGIREFRALGISAGAPYCYGLAATMPGRVRKVAVLSGLGIVNEPQTRAFYSSESQRAFESFASGSPEEVGAFWRAQLASALDGMPADHPWRDGVVASLAHEAAGPAREAILQQRPWGFDLAAISAPVALWHLTEDPEVPFGTAEIVAERLPTAVLNIQSAPGHAPSPASARAAIAFVSG